MKGCVFIGGCPRSGTTILRRLVDSNSDIAIAFEPSSFMFYMDKIKFLYKNNFSEVLEDIKNIEQNALCVPRDTDIRLCEESLRGAIESWYMEYAKIRGKKRWGGKTPSNVLHFDKIKKIFPEAKIIIIVRDGRDVAISMKKFPRIGGNMAYFAELWREYVKKGNEIIEKYPESSMKIYYENLIEKPEQVIKKVLNFVGEKCEGDIIKKYFNYKDCSDKFVSNLCGRSILSKNKNKWKQEMSQKELIMFESIAGHQLKAENYNLSGISAKKSKNKIFVLYGYFRNKTNKYYLRGLFSHMFVIARRLLKRVVFFL